MTISNSSLRQNVFEEIYDLLKAKADAEDFGTATQPNVVASYIDDINAFPQVVIGSANVDEDEYTFDRSNSLKNIVIIIDIYTKKNKNRDILSDNVNTFMKETKIAGITLFNVGEGTAINLDKESKIRNKTITYTFIRR